MADETPTLRLGRQWPAVADAHADKHWRHLMLGDKHVGTVIDATAECITALAAALDPATTARLFDQRDAAITERDSAAALLSEAVELLLRLGAWGLHESKREDLHKQALDLHHRCADSVDSYVYPPSDDPKVRRSILQLRLAEALAEVERMRPVLEAALAVDHSWREENGTGVRVVDPLRALAAAVDVYNQTPSLSPAIDRRVTE